MLVKMYSQTGFNAIDIPENIELIENNFTPYKTETNFELVQSEYLAYIKVGDIETYEARKIDYIIIEDSAAPAMFNKTCYTVETFEFVAPNVCRFKLLLDAYNTLGGFKADSGNMIIAGTANRLSVSLTEDAAKFFTLDEPFRPAEKIKIEINTLNQPRETNINYRVETITIPPKTIEPIVKEGTSQVLGTDLDYHSQIKQMYLGTAAGEYTLKETKTTAAGDVEAFTTGKLINPALRNLISTQLKMRDFAGNTITIGTATRWWLHALTSYEITIDGETIKGDLIKDFRDNGKDADVVAFWHIPSYYITGEQATPYNPEQDENYGGISSISNALINRTLTITPHTVYNNKARYSQSVNVKVYSPVSGAQLDKKIYEIMNAGTTPAAASFSAACIITADIRPSGNPIFIFQYLNGVDQREGAVESINGGAWRSIPLAASGVSNSNYENARINQQANQSKWGAVGQGILGVAQIVGGVLAAAPTGGVSTAAIGSGAATIANAIGSYIDASQTQKDQQELLNMQGQQASAQLTIGNSNFVRDIGKNYFAAVISSYSDADMEAYDTFLTKYGYNVGNKPITNADFYSRPAFNYIRINDITIESVRGSIYLIEQVKQQLRAGVRIWHKKPTPQDMFANGNR